MLVVSIFRNLQDFKERLKTKRKKTLMKNMNNKGIKLINGVFKQTQNMIEKLTIGIDLNNTESVQLDTQINSLEQQKDMLNTASEKAVGLRSKLEDLLS